MGKGKEIIEAQSHIRHCAQYRAVNKRTKVAAAYNRWVLFADREGRIPPFDPVRERAAVAELAAAAAELQAALLTAELEAAKDTDLINFFSRR